jgi:hydrogenase-4 component E
MDSSMQVFCEIVILVMAIIMNITKKNTTVVMLYVIQSLALVVLLGIESFQQQSPGLFLLVSGILVVKVLLAPRIFMGHIRRSHEVLSSEPYLNNPMTLLVLTLLAIFAQSGVFSIFAGSAQALSPALLLIDSALMSFFVIINHRGVLLQIIGVLSLENSIFAAGHFLDPRMSSVLELSILFDVFFWIIVAGVYVRMIHRHYRSLDASSLRELKE